MPSTTYKGYTVPVTGSLSGTWGDEINNNFTTIADLNIGGYATQSLSASNVSLSSTQSNSAIVRLTGTLLASVQVTSSCQGFQFVENLTTGLFTVTWTNGVTGVVIPQGRRVLVISDTTNGCRLGVTSFETGTRMLFQQTTPPTGWTQVTSAAYTNAALRLITTGSAGTGGSALFTDAFAARTIARANLPNDTITTTTNGAHTHTVTAYAQTSPNLIDGSGGPVAKSQSITTSSNGDHTHTIALNGGVTQTTMDFAVKYADVVLATAD